MGREMTTDEARRVAMARKNIRHAGRWPKDHVRGDDGQPVPGCVCSGCRRRVEWAVEDHNRKVAEMEKVLARKRAVPGDGGFDWGA